jgi:hypothetical protein
MLEVAKPVRNSPIRAASMWADFMELRVDSLKMIQQHNRSTNKEIK